MGHSSLSMKRIIVHTGVVDKNYVGEITVMMPGPTDWQFKARGGKKWNYTIIALYSNSVVHEGGFGSTYKTASFSTFEGK